MNIQINVRNFELTESMRILINDKLTNHLDKLLFTYNDEMKRGAISIEKEKLGEFRVSFDMQFPGKHHIFAQTFHINFESAIIDLTQEIEKQIEKIKKQ